METARTAPSSYPSEAGNGGHRQGDPKSADRLFPYSASCASFSRAAPQRTSVHTLVLLIKCFFSWLRLG
jgi:hypothetical protein